MADEWSMALAELLRKAHDVYPEPILRYNLARALEGLGDGQGASEAYEQYLREAENVPDRGAIQSRIATLRRQIAEREALGKQGVLTPGEHRASGEHRSRLPWIPVALGARKRPGVAQRHRTRGGSATRRTHRERAPSRKHPERGGPRNACGCGVIGSGARDKAEGRTGRAGHGRGRAGSVRREPEPSGGDPGNLALGVHAPSAQIWHRVRSRLRPRHSTPSEKMSERQSESRPRHCSARATCTNTSRLHYRRVMW